MTAVRVRRRVIVSGYVQGVFFRQSARQEAQRWGVGGWVRNRPDGRVEAAFEGTEAAVTACVDWCREGPRHAHVTGVEVHEEPVEGLRDFGIAR